jgi:transposase
MNAHKNARTTPFGRAVMIRRVLQEGWSVTAVAASFEVSTRTVRKWLARFRRAGRAGLENRSSAPHLVPNKLPAPWLTMIARLRREYRMTGEEIAVRLRLPRSTVASHLWRLRLGRLAALEPSEPARRYSRARAGELVHLDIKKLARFRRIGHRITGDPPPGLGRVPGGSSSTSRSTTPRAWRTSRSCQTRSASRSPASWSARCAGSSTRASG